MISILAASSDASNQPFWSWATGVAIGSAFVVALVVTWVGQVLVRRVRRKLEGDHGPDETAQLADARRTAAVTSAVTSIISVIAWTLFVFTVLDKLGVNLAPLLASAGIAAVALGFGAQTMVRDYLAGLFILTENQFGVGDSVDLGVGGAANFVTGRIEAVTLRRTSIRQKDGSLVTTGNGNIMVVTNRSRGMGRLVVELQVPHAGSLKDLRDRLDELVDELRQDERLRRLAPDGIEAGELEPTGGDDVVVSVIARTRASHRDEVEREIRRRINRALVPFPERARSEDETAAGT
jgi:moderate conductance mechanosensitive channel